jgi:hypothetical protein
MDKILSFLKGFPAELTVGELRAFLEKLTEHATCKHCGRMIRSIRDDEWRHEPNGERGCRAASYREGSGWDDSLNRRSVATPSQK